MSTTPEQPSPMHRCMIRRSQCTVILISLLQAALSIWWLVEAVWIPGSILLFFALCGLIGAAKMRSCLVLMHFIGSTMLFMFCMYSFILYCVYDFHWATFLIGLGIVLIQLGGLGHSRRLFFFSRRYGPVKCGRWRCNRQQNAAVAQEVVIESNNNVAAPVELHAHHQHLIVPEKPHAPVIQAPAPQYAPVPPTSASESQQQPMMFPALMPNGQVQYFMWVPYQVQPPAQAPMQMPGNLQYPQLYPTITQEH